MKYTVTFIISFLALILFAGVSHGLTINTFGASFPVTNSWDDPQSSIHSVLSAKFSGDAITLNLVNGVGGASGSMETWFGEGIKSIILEEIAGYSEKTTFGWYDNTTSGELFSGPDNTLTSASTHSFSSAQSFGFYIDPNGVIGNRMYTEHDRNNGHHQVAIFQVNASNTYILGWEDLIRGDNDYQDMIVSATIAPVPEPATMLLFGTGLLGLAGLRLRKKK